MLFAADTHNRKHRRPAVRDMVAVGCSSLWIRFACVAICVFTSLDGRPPDQSYADQAQRPERRPHIKNCEEVARDVKHSGSQEDPHTRQSNLCWAAHETERQSGKQHQQPFEKIVFGTFSTRYHHSRHGHFVSGSHTILAGGRCAVLVFRTAPTHDRRNQGLKEGQKYQQTDWPGNVALGHFKSLRCWNPNQVSWMSAGKI